MQLEEIKKFQTTTTAASTDLLVIAKADSKTPKAITVANFLADAQGAEFDTNKASIANGDKIAILDSAATDAPKHILWSLIKSTLTTAFDLLYVGLTGNQTVAGNKTLSGVTTLSGALILTPQLLSGAGAVNVTTAVTAYTSTGGAEALTLADGTAGQRKTIIHEVDGGSGVLTPTTATGFTTITFTNVGDSATLVFLATRGWMIESLNGAVAAP